MNKKGLIKTMGLIMLVGLVTGILLFQTETTKAPSWDDNNTDNIGLEYNSTSGVYHLWNEVDDYYINGSSGLQITNHYQEYWSKNEWCVYLKLGTWRRKCAESITWTWQTDTDNSTYVNLTGTASFRRGIYRVGLGIEYYLEKDKDKIRITVGILNKAKDFNGYFIWRIEDIKISYTEEHDRIYLTTINNTNISNPIMSTHEFLLSDNLTLNFNNITKDFVMRDKVDREYLYFEWTANKTALNISSEPEFYNAPVELWIGQFSIPKNSLKKTVFYWKDAPDCTSNCDILAYREGTVTTPRYRLHSGTTWDAEASAQDISGGLEWVKIEANPNKDEKVLCNKDATDDVNCQVWNGTSWGNLQEMSTDASLYRGMDLCYEQSSGDAIVFYVDVGTDSSIIYYRIWDGSTWGSQQTGQDVVSAIRSIRCVSDPNSDYIAIMTHDGTDDFWVSIWDGGSMDGVERDTDMSLADFLWSYDGAFEQSSGDFIYAYYADGDHAIDGGVWDKHFDTHTKINDIISTIDIPSGENSMIDMEANSTTDQILLIVADDDDDVEANVWDGDSWGTSEQLSSNIGAISTQMHPIGLAWEYSGTEAVAVYGITSTAQKYRVWDGSAWGSEQSLPNFVENVDWHQLASDPNSDYIMLTSLGSVNDVATLEWNGTDFESSWTSQETNSNDLRWNAWFTYDKQAPDTTPPQSFDNSTNTTTAGEPNLFSLRWTDETDLDAYIFETNNTGTNTNDSAVAITGTEDWSNITKTLNSSIVYIEWRVYANDSSDNWNVSEIYFLTTISVVDTCSYISGDYEIDCGDDCTNSSINVTGDLNIYSTSAGTVTLTNINFSTFKINATDTCTVTLGDPWNPMGW